jgi:hypothetical protein
LPSWAQHVCHAVGIMMCSIQPSLRTCSVNWFVCIGFIFSVDEVNVAQATLRKMQWMDLASKTIAERPSTKVIQYLLNEATRFGLIMLCKLNQ